MLQIISWYIPDLYQTQHHSHAEFVRPGKNVEGDLWVLGCGRVDPVQSLLFKAIKVWFYTVSLLCGVWPGALSLIWQDFPVFPMLFPFSPRRWGNSTNNSNTVLPCVPKHPNTLLFIFPPYLYTLFPNELQAVVALSEARRTMCTIVLTTFFFCNPQNC